MIVEHRNKLVFSRSGDTAIVASNSDVISTIIHKVLESAVESLRLGQPKSCFLAMNKHSLPILPQCSPKMKARIPLQPAQLQGSPATPPKHSLRPVEKTTADTEPPMWGSITQTLDSFIDSISRSVSGGITLPPSPADPHPATEGQPRLLPDSQPSSLKAEPTAPLGFSFSPAGLLLPYHLGVIEYLVHSGYLTDHTPIAGASAGSIACVCAGLHISAETIMPVLYDMEANLRYVD